MRTSGADGETHLVRGISWTDRERPFLQLLDIAGGAVGAGAPGQPAAQGRCPANGRASGRAMLPR